MPSPALSQELWWRGWGTSPVTAKTTHDTCKLTKKVLLLGRKKNLEQMPRITRRWELRAACSVLEDSAWILDDLDLIFASKFHCGDGETRSLKSHEKIFRWREMGVGVLCFARSLKSLLSGLWGWQSGSVVLGSTYLQKNSMKWLNHSRLKGQVISPETGVQSIPSKD